MYYVNAENKRNLARFGDENESSYSASTSSDDLEDEA